MSDLERIHTNLWQCDGCLIVFLGEKDGEDHIDHELQVLREQGIDPFSPDGMQFVRHHGLMEVGSPCWEAFHGPGNVHPMNVVVKHITDVMFQLMVKEYDSE